MARIVTADEAIALIPDGSTVLVNPMPSEEVYPAFARRFAACGAPRDLTVVWAAGIGPFSEEPKGMNHFAIPGMVRRVIAGHVGLNYAMVKMIAANQCLAYNLPQGVMVQLYRDIAAKRPGILTRIGLGTFVDPRVEGGKMNECTRDAEDLVEVMTIGGREYLFFRAFPCNVGLIRATTADQSGNLSTEDEALTMENVEVAMAVKNSGGFVIAQVARISEKSLHPKRVNVPANLVDYIVVAQTPEAHPHTMFVQHDASYTGDEQVDLADVIKPMQLNIEKVIARRAAAELKKGGMINLGVGIPMGVARVAFEEGVLDQITLSTEVGVIGGLPEGGVNFGPAKNPTAFMAQPQLFDLYDGGGVDVTCVGLAQVDAEGNVNVSRLGPRIIGCGGFINLTQSAETCVFCGEFRAAGTDIVVEDGKLLIRTEGKAMKFVEKVQQITFSGPVAREEKRNVVFVTERCVFRLVPEGMLLAEVAPGIDIERDIVNQMGFRPIIPDNVPLMNPAIFRDEPMGLTIS